MDPESKPYRGSSIEAARLLGEEFGDLKVVEAMSEAVVVLGMDGTILRVNREFERGIGWGREDAVGKTPVELGLMSEEGARKVETELVPRLMGKGVLRDIEMTGIRRDGTSFPALMSWTLIRDSRGQPSCIISVAMDITERRRAEQELREFRDIINRSPALVFVWRVAPGEWPVEFVSDNVKQVIGYTADDFMSGRVSWPGITHPDDVARLEAEVAAHIESGTMEWSQEYRLIIRSGETRWMSDRNLFLKDEKGDLARIQSIVVDITERKIGEESLKKSEAELRARTLALEQKNIAFKEIVQHIEEEKNMMRADLSANVEEVLMPVVEKLKMGADAGEYADLLEHHLRELTSEFGLKVTRKGLNLSIREVEICSMIRGGLRSKDIARLLNVSHQTIEKHRKNIRKKLGISSKDINLSSYLREL